eukprot:COSAG01_NODE_6592_length_3588_cov_10.651476_2_plen_118_part_00
MCTRALLWLCCRKPDYNLCVLSGQGLSPRAASASSIAASATTTTTTTTLGHPSAATISKIDFDNARRALAHRQRQDKLQRQAQRLQQQQQQRLQEVEEKEKKARSTRSVGTQGELFM